MAHTEKISFKQFRDKFASENDCRDYFREVRWSEGYICPKCGCKEFMYLKCRGGIYQCRNCRHQTTLTAGTIMHRTHLPLTTWFWAIYLVSRDKRGISATQLAAELELSYETAWYLLKRIRAAMGQREQKYLLSGITEMDDFYYGGPDQGGKRGRGTEQMNVMVALSKTEDGKPQFLKMQVVDDLKEPQSELSHIPAFPPAQRYRAMAIPVTVSLWLVNMTTSTLCMTHTRIFCTGSTWSLVMPKHFCWGLTMAIAKNLQMYLNEFCYRFNRRFFKNELFTRLLHAVAQSNILWVAV